MRHLTLFTSKKTLRGAQLFLLLCVTLQEHKNECNPCFKQCVIPCDGVKNILMKTVATRFYIMSINFTNILVNIINKFVLNNSGQHKCDNNNRLF